MPNDIPTAQHEEQDAEQRGHDHQQGQPHALPHFGEGGKKDEARKRAQLEAGWRRGRQKKGFEP